MPNARTNSIPKIAAKICRARFIEVLLVGPSVS
jgi:hypothetical protein